VREKCLVVWCLGAWWGDGRPPEHSSKLSDTESGPRGRRSPRGEPDSLRSKSGFRNAPKGPWLSSQAVMGTTVTAGATGRQNHTVTAADPAQAQQKPVVDVRSAEPIGPSGCDPARRVARRLITSVTDLAPLRGFL